MMTKKIQKFTFLSALVAGVLLAASCSQKDSFLQPQTSQIFLQEYNPAYIDILWVVDNRSPLSSARDHLIAEGKNFFKRLESSTNDYQMAFITSDVQTSYGKGQLQPIGNPTILKRNVGTVDQRTNLFGSTIAHEINLRTGGESKGAQAAMMSLTQYFKPRDGAPLVVVFMSDSYDHSDKFTATPTLDYYYNALLSLKGGNPDLLKIYSINYLPLSTGEDLSSTPKRCATRYNADIDSTTRNPDWFDYFAMATKSAGSTGDLCGSFASMIDLTGLRRKDLSNRFKLDQVPQVDTITVNIFRGKEEFNIKFTFDEKTNELVFDSVPPQGSTIQVSYAIR